MATIDLPPYRPCDLCGGIDQDPRHSFSGVISDHWTPDLSIRPSLDKNLNDMVTAGDLSVSQAIDIGTAFSDTTSTDRHLDCCASAGCPLKGTEQDAAACDHRVAAAKGKTGEGMRKAALSLNKEN